MFKKIILLAIAAFSINTAAFAVNPLEALTGIVSDLTSSSNFEVSDIVGTWNYESPAISFESDNALNKIGGAAASEAIESKMETYYNKIGLNTMSLTIESSSTDGEYSFAMTIRKYTFKGTITKNDDAGQLTFQFNALGKINLGKISAKAEKSATSVLSLTFDATKFITLVSKIASITNNSTVQTLSSLLNSYDGLYAGAKFTKSGSSSTSSTSTSTGTSTESSSSSSSSAGSALKSILSGVLNK